MLILDSKSWTLEIKTDDHAHRFDGSWSPTDSSSLVEQITEHIKDTASRVRKISVLLDASLCVSALYKMDSAGQARKREAVLYRIEEHLPLATEDIVADFVRRGSEVFAVAVASNALEPVLKELQQRRLVIELVTPLAVLAWQRHFNANSVAGPSAAAWINHDNAGQLVLFEGRLPTRWVKFGSVSELCRQLAFERLFSPGPLPLSIYCPPGHQIELNAISSLAQASFHTGEDMTLPSFAIGMLDAIRSGRSEPMLDFSQRMAGTARKGRGRFSFEVTLLQVGALLFLASMLLSNLIVTSKYRAAVDKVISAQEDVWRESFPDSRLPRGIGPRLQSELAKMSGVRGTLENSVPDQSVLPPVVSVVQSIPKDMRFRLLDLRIEDQKLDLTGEVRDFADADQIATEIRRVGFMVMAPTTRRLAEQGVGLRLQGQLQSRGSNEGESIE